MCLDKDCPGGHASPPSPFASVLGGEPTVPPSPSAPTSTTSHATASSGSSRFIIYRYPDGTSEYLKAINIPAFVFYDPPYVRPKRFNKKSARKKWDEAEFRRWKTALNKARGAAAATRIQVWVRSILASACPGTASPTEEATGAPPSEEGASSSATPSPLERPAPARATEADPVVVPESAPRTRGGETDAAGVPSATPSPQAPLASPTQTNNAAIRDAQQFPVESTPQSTEAATPSSAPAQASPASPRTTRSVKDSEFSPTTERARREILRCLEKKDDADRTKLLGSIIEQSAVNKPSIIEWLFGKVKCLLRAQQPSAATASRINPSPNDPIDEKAFEYYDPSRYNGQHRSVGNASRMEFDIQSAGRRAKNRKVRNNVDAILDGGDADQITLGLRDTLEHPEVRPYSERVLGDWCFSEEAKVGRALVRGIRSMTEKVAETKNNGVISRTCRSLLTTLLMPVANGDEDVSKTAIGRQLLGSFSRPARRRLLKRAGIKRKRFNEEDLKQFSMLDEEKKRWKYTEADINGLRNYMVNNIYTRQSPMKNDTVFERDYNGENAK